MKSINPNKNKTNYFYIDESGSLLGDSNVFIHGCIKTDSPDTILNALNLLKQKLADDPLYEKVREKILKKGFHACENDADTQAAMYSLLLLLDYRAYFVLIDKDSDYFKSQEKEEHEWFSYSLKKLILDRIKANRGAKNYFYFETIQISKKPLKAILSEIFDNLSEEHNCEFEIVGKEIENLAVVDYLNYLFFHIFSKKVETWPKMKTIFDLVSQKIAVVNILHNDIFLSRKKTIDCEVTYENLISKYGGTSG